MEAVVLWEMTEKVEDMATEEKARMAGELTVQQEEDLRELDVEGVVVEKTTKASLGKQSDQMQFCLRRVEESTKPLNLWQSVVESQ